MKAREEEPMKIKEQTAQVKGLQNVGASIIAYFSLKTKHKCETKLF